MESPTKKSTEKVVVDSKSCLTGMIFVVTGQFDMSTRPKIEQLIRDHGGRVVDSVTKSSQYLITGRVLDEKGRPAEEGKKYQEALKLGKIIFKEEQFEEFIREKSNNLDFSLSGGVVTTKSPVKRSTEVKVSEAVSPMSTEMWTDLYQPKTREDLLGNEGLVEQLEDWLKDWDDVHIRGNKKTFN